MSKHRSAYFDNLKGILIFLVVLGHLTQGRGDFLSVTIRYYIYIFHMPLFIFISGVFAKSTIKENGKLDVSKIFYYLLLGMLFSYSLTLIDKFIFSADIDLRSVNPFVTSDIPWYLIALGVYASLTPFFSRFKPLFAIIASIVFSTFFNYFSIPNIFCLQKCIIDLPFFLMGFYFSTHQISNFVDTLKGKKLIFISLAVLTVIPLLALIIKPSAGDLVYFYTTAYAGDYRTIFELSSMNSHYSFGLAIVLRLTWYFFAIAMSLFLMLVTPKNKLHFATQIGKNSLSVYIYHAYVARFLIFSGLQACVFPESQVLFFVSMFLLSVAVTLLLGLPSCLGKPFIWIKRFCDYFMTKVTIS